MIAVSIYCYLIKYRAKQKHLLSFHFTNNELKEIKSKTSNKVKDINIKNRTYYFYILVYYIVYVRIKDLEKVKINSINSLYLIFSKDDGYFEEINCLNAK